jgi:hypothetical protein
MEDNKKSVFFWTQGHNTNYIPAGTKVFWSFSTYRCAYRDVIRITSRQVKKAQNRALTREIMQITTSCLAYCLLLSHMRTGFVIAKIYNFGSYLSLIRLAAAETDSDFVLHSRFNNLVSVDAMSIKADCVFDKIRISSNDDNQKDVDAAGNRGYPWGLLASG